MPISLPSQIRVDDLISHVFMGLKPHVPFGVLQDALAPVIERLGRLEELASDIEYFVKNNCPTCIGTGTSNGHPCDLCNHLRVKLTALGYLGAHEAAPPVKPTVGVVREIPIPVDTDPYRRRDELDGLVSRGRKDLYANVLLDEVGKLPRAERAAELLRRVEKNLDERFHEDLKAILVDRLMYRLDEELGRCIVCGEKPTPECVKHLSDEIRSMDRGSLGRRRRRHSPHPESVATLAGMLATPALSAEGSMGQLDAIAARSVRSALAIYAEAVKATDDDQTDEVVLKA